jgi:hypothetical protein
MRPFHWSVSSLADHSVFEKDKGYSLRYVVGNIRHLVLCAGCQEMTLSITQRQPKSLDQSADCAFLDLILEFEVVADRRAGQL